MSLAQTGSNNHRWNGGKVKALCQWCGKDFYIIKSRIKTAKYCSKKCYSLGSRKRAEYACIICGEVFECYPSFIKKHCSKECRDIGRKGDNNPRWRGGKIGVKQREWKKQKYDLVYRLNKRMSIGMWNALKGKKNYNHWEDLAGYTYTELKNRLSATMPKGYTWADFLSGELHIDHIIPKSLYNYNSPDDAEFKKCWALNNLQLLPATENISKGNKVVYEYRGEIKNVLAMQA